MRVKLKSLRESSQFKANSLSSALTERDELKDHLHREQERIAITSPFIYNIVTKSKPRYMSI